MSTYINPEDHRPCFYGTVNTKLRYAGIGLVVDGVKTELKDACGETVQPFIYEGSVWLPANAIADVIGKKIVWDGLEKTVYICDTAKEAVQRSDGGTPYLLPYKGKNVITYANRPDERLCMGGKEYQLGIMFTQKESNVVYNLDGEYEYVDFYVGFCGGVNAVNSILYISLDGKMVKEIELSPDMKIQHIDINVGHALQIKFDRKYNGCYGIANVRGFKQN